MIEPERPPPAPPAERTSRRAYLLIGALLVAFAAGAFLLSRCDRGPTPPEDRRTGMASPSWDAWTFYCRKFDAAR